MEEEKGTRAKNLIDWDKDGLKIEGKRGRGKEGDFFSTPHRQTDAQLVPKQLIPIGIGFPLGSQLLPPLVFTLPHCWPWDYVVASLGQVFCRHPLLTSPSLLCTSSPAHWGEQREGGRGGGMEKYFGALQACSTTTKTVVCYQHVLARNPKHSIKSAATK